jgi:glycogen debranching enzyme
MLFERDSIIATLEVLLFDPAMAEQTLRLLAARLGTRVDDEHDMEPGKVLHELRRASRAPTRAGSPACRRSSSRTAVTTAHMTSRR